MSTVRATLLKSHKNPQMLFLKSYTDATKVYYEFDWLLECFPRSITCASPLEKLMWLKQRKKKGIYLHDMERVNPSDYDRETLQLLRYMLEGVDYHTTYGLTDKEKEDK